MKRNKLFLHLVFLGAACVLLGGNAICRFIYANGLSRMSNMYFYDLYLRYNEIECAHDGIDPFDIFERKKTSEKFWGIPRPDKSDERLEERLGGTNRRFVHAYPAWHTAVFWWYGFIPYYVCIIMMVILYFCSLVWICKWIVEKMHKRDPVDNIEDILFLFVFVLYPFTGICCSLNYGLFLLGCTLLLLTLLERKHEVLAGVIFSLIMIKPQIGIILLIPLFVNRNYKTIAIAGAICILETLFTAWQLDKSPIELILHLPKIGAPFSKGFLAETANKLLGPMGQYLVMGTFMGVATIGCFLVRDAKEVWVRFLPAFVVIPFWTYSQAHDWLVVVPCFIYVINNRQKHPRLYDSCVSLIILWSVVFFCYEREWYSVGKKGVATILLLALFSIIYYMIILENNKKAFGAKFYKYILNGRPPKKTPSDKIERQ